MNRFSLIVIASAVVLCQGLCLLAQESSVENSLPTSNSVDSNGVQPASLQAESDKNEMDAKLIEQKANIVKVVEYQKSLIDPIISKLLSPKGDSFAVRLQAD